VKKVAVGLLTILPVAVVGASLRGFAGQCSVPEAIAAEILLRATSSGDRHDGRAVREEQG
jgi:hypothetical protein